jgi:undecaprenyl phosphate N,N'-diacetylbacillosamine 1-phosphate transferase
VLYRVYIKPFSDFLAALLILIIASPVWVLTIFLLAFANRGKVWFIQARPGLHEKIFYIMKFKTMTDANDSQGNLLPDAQRLTMVGKLVRKLSIDELPQLLNVMRGEMSIVGPRPLLVEYLSLYSKEQKRRHQVRPGITGWAQVNGRNAISWQQKFTFDTYYVDTLSFGLDIKILWLTILKVLKAEGISSEGQATIEKFKGE